MHVEDGVVTDGNEGVLGTPSSVEELLVDFRIGGALHIFLCKR